MKQRNLNSKIYYHLLPLSDMRNFDLLHKHVNQVYHKGIDIFNLLGYECIDIMGDFDRGPATAMKDFSLINSIVEDLWLHMRDLPVVKSLYKDTVMDVLRHVTGYVFHKYPDYLGGITIPRQFIERPNQKKPHEYHESLSVDNKLVCGRYGTMYLDREIDFQDPIRFASLLRMNPSEYELMLIPNKSNPTLNLRFAHV